MTADRPGFVLVDDDVARGFEPFALTRPVGELRAGGALMRHRWIQALAMPCIGFIAGPHLDAFAEFDSAPVASAVLPSGTVLVNARCAPALGTAVHVTLSNAQKAGGTGALAGASPGSWRCGGRVAAVRLSEPLDTAALRADGAAAAAAFENVRVEGATTELDGWWLDAVWDLIGHLSEMLQADAIALMPTTGAQVPATLTVLGGHPVHVEAGATIEPFVVADASAGAVLIRRGAHVHAFTRLVGPCIIGEEVVVLGGRLAACSIGERVKVHGELNSTIFIGHANKGHDGFVGHSVIGRWANLGAGTITSNLKNSYGTVALRTPSGTRDTGLQFLGSLLGDHVKTGIGTRLTTGCVVGAGANIFGSTMPPKAVAPFAWGESPTWETFALERFLVVAERVMARREVALSAAMRAQLSTAHAMSQAATYAARWRA